MKKTRVGMYGGTFSPCHLGHMRAAGAFLSQMKLDQLYIVPTKIPPHKSVDWDDMPWQRYEMLKLAFADMPGVEVSDIELRREGKSYTAITLQALSSPDRELFLLVGTDMFLTLDSWYCPEKIFALSSIVCARRESTPQNKCAIEAKAAEYKIKFGAKIYCLDYEAAELSSSEIRDKIARGEDYSALVSPPVYRYIKEHGCYERK